MQIRGKELGREGGRGNYSSIFLHATGGMKYTPAHVWCVMASSHAPQWGGGGALHVRIYDGNVYWDITITIFIAEINKPSGAVFTAAIEVSGDSGS